MNNVERGQRTCVCYLSLIGLNIGGWWTGVVVTSLYLQHSLRWLHSSTAVHRVAWLLVCGPKDNAGKRRPLESHYCLWKCWSRRCADWILSLTQSSQSGPVWVLWWFIILKLSEMQTRASGLLGYCSLISTAGRLRCKASGSFAVGWTSFGFLVFFLTALKLFNFRAAI